MLGGVGLFFYPKTENPIPATLKRRSEDEKSITGTGINVYRNQCQPFGIYADARMVGYVMVIYDPDVPEYDIWHMMIDAAEQGKGYGTAAMKAVLDYIATKPLGDSGRVVLTCHHFPGGRRAYHHTRTGRSV